MVHTRFLLLTRNTSVLELCPRGITQRGPYQLEGARWHLLTQVLGAAERHEALRIDLAKPTPSPRVCDSDGVACFHPETLVQIEASVFTKIKLLGRGSTVLVDDPREPLG